jgi:hypothetical protein
LGRKKRLLAGGRDGRVDVRVGGGSCRCSHPSHWPMGLQDRKPVDIGRR